MSGVPTPMADRREAMSAGLPRRIAGFLHVLRGNGFAVGAGEGQDAARLLAAGYGRTPALLRSAFRALFSACKADWEKFEAVFDAYWLRRRIRERLVVAAEAPAAGPQPAAALREGQAEPSRGSVDQQPAAGTDTTARPGQGRAEGASAVDALDRTDFRKLADPAQLAAAHEAAVRLARAMRTRLTRRDLARRRGDRLDLRRTIHRNVSHGGVPVSLVRRRRKRKPLRLVVLLDASGSMSLYTGMYLRFVHGVLDAFHEAHAFLFHTRLAHVSDAMRERDAGRALDRLSMLVQGSGGGTRIGESLQTFNRLHARRVIHARTCVMIVSDGYDTGDPELLAGEMRRLAGRCRRIVWLNPMMGWDGYAPVATGIRAALPYVEMHAPGHTLAGLAALEPYLARL